MTQSEAVLKLFQDNGNQLTTADFANDRTLCCEYRRALCELRAKGWRTDVSIIRKGLYRYVLHAPVKFEEVPNGQLRMAL